MLSAAFEAMSKVKQLPLRWVLAGNEQTLRQHVAWTSAKF